MENNKKINNFNNNTNTVLGGISLKTFFAILTIFIITTSLMIGSIMATTFLNNNTVKAATLTGTWQDSGFVDTNWFNNWPNRGTAEHPFLISTPQELAGLANLVNGVGNTATGAATGGLRLAGVHIRLTNDINLTYPNHRAWIAIGGPLRNFQGVLDGNGHTITLPDQLRSVVNSGTGTSPAITIAQNTFGLFGMLANNAVVRNLELTGNVSSITRAAAGAITSPRVGAVTGMAVQQAVVEHVTSRVNFSALGTNTIMLGGLVGRAESGQGTVGNPPPAYNSSVRIRYSANYGTISSIGGTLRVGGVVGEVQMGARMHNLKNHGDITLTTGADARVGGIAGHTWAPGGNTNILFHNLVNNGNINITLSGTANTLTRIGGIAGNADQQTTWINLANHGNIQASGGGTAAGTAANNARAVGGLMGRLQQGAHIVNSSNTGNVSGFTTSDHHGTGGIIGRAESASVVINTYNAGVITGRASNHSQIVGSGTLTVAAGNSVDNFGIAGGARLNPATAPRSGLFEAGTWGAISNTFVLQNTAGLGIRQGQELTVAMNAGIQSMSEFLTNNAVQWVRDNNNLPVLNFPEWPTLETHELATVSLSVDEVITREFYMSIGESVTVNSLALPNPAGTFYGWTNSQQFADLGFVRWQNNSAITINANTTLYAVRDFVALIPETPAELPAPTNVSVDANGLLTWDAVARPVDWLTPSYRIYIDGSFVATVEETQFNLNPQTLGVGNHTIGVVAVGDNLFTSNSEAATTIFEITRLSAPTVTVGASGIASWNAITGATGYIITVDGQTFNQAGTTFDLSALNLELGSWSIEVVAVGNGGNVLNSYAGSASFTRAQLSAPVLNIDTNLLLSWSAIANANSYTVALNGNIVSSGTTDLGFNLHELNLSAGIHNLQVTAIGDGFFFANSIAGDTSFEIVQLSTPVLTRSGNNITWATIAGALHYDIFFNGTLVSTVASTDTLSLDLTTLTFVEGSSTITVVAVGNGITNRPSNQGTLNITTTQLSAPTNIQLSGTDLIWGGITGAIGYRVEVRNSNNDIIYTSNVMGESYYGNFRARISTLNTTGTRGEILVFVYSLGNEIDTLSSTISGAGPVFNISSLATPVLTLNSNMILSWGAIANAQSYEILNITNDTSLGITTATSFDLASITTETGSFQFGVRALRTTDIFTWTTSENATLTLTVNQPQTPTPTVGSNAVVSWGADALATAFRVYIDNVLIDTITTTSFNLAPLSLGVATHAIRVVAVGGVSTESASSTLVATRTLNSYAGNTNAVIARLSTPSGISINSNFIVSWEAVVNAVEYEVFVNGDSRGRTANLQLDITSAVSADIGSHTVEVIAIADGLLFRSSSAGSYTFEIAQLTMSTLNLNAQMMLSWASVDNAISYTIIIDGQTFNQTGTTFDLATLSLGLGSWSVQVVAVGNGTLFVDSYAQTYNFTIARIAAPTISVDANMVLNWNAVVNATGYQIFINGSLSETINASTLMLDLTTLNLGVGSYDIYVVALGNGFLFRDSLPSNIATFSITTLATPVLTSENLIVSWEAVPNAISYNVYFNGSLLGNMTGTTADFTSFIMGNVGTYTIEVIAIGDGLFFLNSEAALYTITVGKLDTPNVNLSSQMVVSWEAVASATNYQIYVNGLLRSTVSTLQFDLTTLNLGAGYHHVEVIAIGNQYLTVPSDAGVYNFSITQLTAPTVTVAANHIVSWNAVFGATGYRITIGEFTQNLTATSFNLDSVSLQEGANAISIVALGTGYFLLDSNEGYATVTITRLATPGNINININTKILTWDAVANAEEYQIFKDGVLIATQNTRSFDFSVLNLPAAIYEIQVVAISTDLNLWNSLPATAYLVIELATLATPNPSININLILSWASVPMAEGYEIFIDGQLISTITTNSFDLNTQTFTIGQTYTITVVAIGDGIFTTDSNAGSADLIIIKLATPQLNISNQMLLTWGADTDALEFEVWINGVLETTTTQNQLDLSTLNLGTGSHIIEVIAIGNNVFFITSDAGITTLVIGQLSAPDVSIDSQKIISWDSVDGANEYQIFVNGTLQATITTTTFDLKTLNLTVGDFTVTVVAIADSVFTLDSAAGSVSFNITQLATPANLSINDRLIASWDAVTGVWFYRGRVGTQTWLTPSLSADLSFDNLSVGTHTLQITALSNNPFVLDSDIASVQFTIARLETPVVSVNNQLMASWQTIEGTAWYRIRIGNSATVHLSAIPQFNLATLGLGAGTHTINVEALAPFGDRILLDSLVGSTAITITQLSTPILSVDSHLMLRWNAITGALGYRLLVNGEIVETITDATVLEFDLTALNLGAGTHNIQVIALGTGYLVLNSNAGTYTLSISQLGTPVLSVNQNMLLTWVLIDDALEYKVYVNGVLQDTVVTNSFDLSALNLNLDTHNIAVVAVGDGLTILNSSAGTTTVTVSQLPSPVVTITNLTASWNAINNASSYRIYIDGIYRATTTLTAYNLSTFGLSIGSYQILVIAVGDGLFWLPSNSDNTVALTIVQLDAPSITVNNQLIASWEAITGASAYRIYVNGVARGIITDTTFNIAALSLGLGNHNIEVITLGNNLNLLDSNIGRRDFTIAQLGTPVITINQLIASWEAIAGATGYRIQVGEFITTITELEFDLTTLNLGVGNHAISVTAIGSGLILLNSYAGAENFTISRLDTPQLSINNQMIVSWEVVSGATAYIITVGNFTDTITATSFDLCTLQLGVGEHEIRVIAISEDINVLNSFEGIETITIIKLQAPILEVSNNMMLSWSAVSNASSYRIYVNGSLVATITDLTNLEFDLKTLELGVGVHNIAVVAVGDGLFFLENTGTTSFAIARLATPQLTLVNANIVWETIFGATGYQVIVNGENKGTTTNTYFNLENLGLSIGNHNIQVIAISGNLFAVNSDITTLEFTIAKLAAPILTVANQIVAWETISNATGYEVFVNGISRGIITTTYFDAAILEDGIYTISVVAIGDGFLFTNSDMAEIEVTVITPAELPQPDNLEVNNNHMLTWEAVANAVEYRVILNGQIVAIVKATYFNIGPYLVAGENVIEVIAIGDNVYYLDSAVSSITYNHIVPAFELNLMVLLGIIGGCIVLLTVSLIVWIKKEGKVAK